MFFCFLLFRFLALLPDLFRLIHVLGLFTHNNFDYYIFWFSDIVNLLIRLIILLQPHYVMLCANAKI